MTEQTYSLGSWQLNALYSSFEAPEVEESFAQLEQQISAFEEYRQTLEGEVDEETFRQILDDYDQLNRLESKLGGYAGLRFSEDTQNQRAQTFRAKIQQKSAELNNRSLFFRLWWKGLDEDRAQELLEAAGDYRYWLEALRLQSPYTLSEPEEKIINIKDVNGASALMTLYSSITNRYTFELEVEGETLELTRGELSRYVWGTDPALRKAAYEEMNRVFGEDASILGQIYQFRARDWHSEHVQLRGYDSPIAVRNLSNDIPDEVVDTLLDVSRQNAGLFQDFFKLKAEWLGVDRLRRYDIYAPVAEADKEYSYPEAIDLVLSSYRQFEPEVANLAERIFNEGHIDSEVRKGKRSGAFCMTVNPDITPYILQSYDGAVRDVATLAHELGHAVHSMLASHHTSLTQRSSLPLAETASTFGEMLVVDQLLENEQDPAVRRDLLFRQLDDNYATIMRQVYFALFERSAHDAVQQGASVDELSELYLENLAEQFGDAVDVAESFRHEWIAIPHFYAYPFYVYAYSFGQLLVLSLYQRYQEQGDEFKPGYLDILRAGGSASPMDVLARADIDVRQASFWQGGFDVLAGILEELQKMERPAPAG